MNGPSRTCCAVGAVSVLSGDEMNYRHAFHAGNFADLLKHAVVLQLVDRLTAAGGPLQVFDTHAGAGAYDLRGEEARKSGEAEAGLFRLMSDAAAPVAFDSLKAAVNRLNPASPVQFYPGSPLLVAAALRPMDRYLGCELRADDFASLTSTLRPYPNAVARQTDGYAAVLPALAAGLRTLVLIDPPFEAADDYEQIASTVQSVCARAPEAVLAIWVPLKDLETFDSLLRRLEDRVASTMLIAESRLRPLDDPMKMNGCAMLVVNPPAGLEMAMAEAAQWVAAGHGHSRALGRVWWLRT
jgi:23S rRNA (adenine2030-N6)-methyltransferase